MGAKRRDRRKIISLLVVAVLAGGLGVAAYATHLLGRSELQTIDARFSIRGKQHPPSDIELVGIDQPTFAELRNHHLESEAPLPRKYDAKVLDNLRAAGAMVIAVDLEFTHPSGTEQETEELFEAVGRARGKTVLATVEVEPGGRTEIFGGHLAEVGARAGEVRFPYDSDGSVRNFEYSYNGLHSFPVVASEIATGRPIGAERFDHGRLPIDFVGPPESVHEISYYDALTDHFPASAVSGKIVIVGATDPILQDVHATATGPGMPGSEIWANAIATLLKGIPLRYAPGWLNVLLVVLLGIAVPLASMRLRQLRSLLVAVGLAALFTLAVQLAFDDGRIISFVYPLLALALATLGTLAVLYMSETLERERVRAVFSRFVNENVVEQVLASADENLRLGGVERECTVLFSDLRSFTSFSESQPAAKVIEVVNYYLNEMTEAILGEGGTLIAYMGDGIMAVFGAPLEQDDHADRALRAAREMIGPRLDHFNAWLTDQGFPSSFVMGVGLNTGPVMAGNVGSERRVEYTAIGDTTNTASRLEGMTKGHEEMLFMASSTRERMLDPPADLARVGEFEVRGRTAKMEIWTIALTGSERAEPEPAGNAE